MNQIRLPIARPNQHSSAKSLSSSRIPLGCDIPRSGGTAELAGGLLLVDELLCYIFSTMSEADEKPWTEEQWEAFMKRQDLKAARFGEILETVIDDPNRYEFIEKEMGWDMENGPAVEIPELTEDEEEEINQQMKQEDEALERIPACHKSMEVATKVQRLLKPLFKNSEDDPDEDISDALSG